MSEKWDRMQQTVEGLRGELERTKETCKKKVAQLLQARTERDAALQELATWARNAGDVQSQLDTMEKQLRHERAATEELGDALASIQERGLVDRIRNRPPQVVLTSRETRQGEMKCQQP